MELLLKAGAEANEVSQKVHVMRNLCLIANHQYVCMEVFKDISKYFINVTQTVVFDMDKFGLLHRIMDVQPINQWLNVIMNL